MSTKILVIEDNEQNLYLVSFILKARGYEILQARDGRQGLEMAARHKPSLVLLDMQLPAKDGYTVAREIKENSILENVPIVAVTSCAMVGDRERILAAGCEGYIEKPINPETFLGEVEKHLPAGASDKGMKP